MKNLILIFICLFCFLEASSQDNNIYFVTAPSGLSIRAQPNLNAPKTGKLPYGSTIEVLVKTKIKLKIVDNKDTIYGNWVKIKYDNFPFIVSALESEHGFDQEGYVFNGYLEKLIKASVVTQELDSLTFKALFVDSEPSNRVKITSIEETEKLLASRVKWKEIEGLGYEVDEIILDNGQVLRINQKSNDYRFLAYYPNEEILLFEGGHSSESSISIKTGESLETVGHPGYMVESPNKKLRLNGWFPGQECSSYFFQEKTGDRYTYLVDFGWGSEESGADVCYFNKFCWINDTEFVYNYTAYQEGLPFEKYAKVRIVK